MAIVHICLVALSLLSGLSFFGAKTVETVCYTTDNCATSINAQDKYLGDVNLCDPEGTVCLTVKAYLDGSNDRIYLIIAGKRYYSQKSNDSRWALRVRYSDKWYYFDF